MSDFARLQEENSALKAQNAALKDQIDRMWALMTKAQLEKLEHPKAAHGAAK
jgi:hypothetical protein